MGGQHIIRILLFEINFCNWGNNELSDPASGDGWQFVCHQGTALLASDLYNYTKSFLNEESQCSLELFILTTVTSYDIQIYVNVILAWCFLH